MTAVNRRIAQAIASIPERAAPERFPLPAFHENGPGEVRVVWWNEATRRGLSVGHRRGRLRLVINDEGAATCFASIKARSPEAFNDIRKWAAWVAGEDVR